MALINSKESDFGPAYADKKIYNFILYFNSSKERVGSIDITTGQKSL